MRLVKITQMIYLCKKNSKPVEHFWSYDLNKYVIHQLSNFRLRSQWEAKELNEIKSLELCFNRAQ